jgi:hypothetical protein
LYRSEGTTQSAFSCRIFVSFLLDLYCSGASGDGSVMVVNVRNCCIYWVCCMDGLKSLTFVRFIVDSSISCYGPVIVQGISSMSIRTCWFYISNSTFDSQFLRKVSVPWLWKWVCSRRVMQGMHVEWFLIFSLLFSKCHL